MSGEERAKVTSALQSGPSVTRQFDPYHHQLTTRCFTTQKRQKTQRTPRAEKSTPKEATDSDTKEYPDKGLNAEGENFFKLTGKRRVTVRQYKDIPMVDIREYYGGAEDPKPGAKGISLTLEQYEKLKELIPEIDAAIQEL
ncbi:transcriptional Coactivator p15-domain-containing protein [Endogone sp. FLAS-F59071]|nr:transcriptional Coactivator p15-domain-containing protein [Endogone sp. FLAS-F59071]|eukprot:RUS15857.1 transcriptional Coactivator p15-domain-containing protein [Endogone sp. FLAS-F59071]